VSKIIFNHFFLTKTFEGFENEVVHQKHTVTAAFSKIFYKYQRNKYWRAGVQSALL